MAVGAAAKADKSQERFENALRDLFVGAPVEGQSGFINLMRIKSRYYTDGVFPRLQQDTAAALKPFPGFRQEHERPDAGSCLLTAGEAATGPVKCTSTCA